MTISWLSFVQFSCKNHRLKANFVNYFLWNKLLSLMASVWAKSCHIQGRSQDFSVGTHSFPSHLFTPPPPPKKRSKSFSIHVSFISNRVRKSLNWIQINLFFCLLFLWVSMCERHCLSCESTTFCSSPFASIYVTYYKKQQCVHGFITPTDKNSI